MHVRVTGLPVECQAVVDVLVATLDVVEVSEPHPNRGRSGLVRVYVTVSTSELIGPTHRRCDVSTAHGGVAGCACSVCLDFGDLPGMGPCPTCRSDAYAEHICTIDAQNQASKQTRQFQQVNPKLQTRRQPITRSEP